MGTIDLSPFGWTPGSYWFVCRDCRNKQCVGSKRSWRCEICAKAAADKWEEPVHHEATVMTSEVKRCPFCHKTSHLKISPFYEPSFEGYYGFNVVCSAAGFDNTDRGCGAAGSWGETEADATTRWNTRPAPVTTDTGLVTVTWQHQDYDDWHETRVPDYHKNRGRAVRELVTRSQAEDRLTEKDVIIRSHLATIATLNADNAAKDAQILELGGECNELVAKCNEIIGQRDHALNTCVQMEDDKEAMEAKLAAANTKSDKMEAAWLKAEALLSQRDLEDPHGQ